VEQSDVYKLVLHPDPRLKKKLTEEVHWITDEHKAIAEKMLRTMYQSKGVGLSTPQVGLEIRLIVLDDGTGPLVMFNPFVTNKLPKTKGGLEGCLSFPKLYKHVKRYETIAVRYRGLDNVVREEQFSGLQARIILHEIDHLNGLTFLER
jgi:peptide deformylase